MEAIIFLSIIIALFSIFVSCLVIRRVKKQIAEITDALADVKNGNGNRRILSATNELVAPLAYEINEIVVSYEKRLSTVRQAEETNRQLMTSLSHDVRTPLTTLIGYLDAAHRGIVTGKDKDDYIETARRKAHDLKEYIDILFDWFKLNSNEFAMDINTVEAAELTRNILIDWIPIFEDRQIDYNIDIPEQPFRVKLDTDGYMRILNNLIQNVISHSHADKIEIFLSKQEKNMQIRLTDNGICGVLSIIFGLICSLFTIIAEMIVGFPGFQISLALKAALQITAVNFFLYIAVLPIIIITCRKAGSFLVGVIIAFVYGYGGMFAAGNMTLANLYPITASLGMIGYRSYDTAVNWNILTCICSLAVIVVISAVLIICMKETELKQAKKKAKKAAPKKGW